MAHTFTATFHGDPSALLQKVKTKITGDGGRFNGDTTGGSFSGKTAVGEVSLKYQIQASNTIHFTITDKPFLLPNGTVESTVRSYIS
jgi:hypothetical protein